jgi:rhamnose utilization protein RhaD (predicted bifunctional aldolase and dehydrogenase)
MQQPGFLDELRRMSARIGGDMLLVQGAGGNSSLKRDGVLWVKASGAWLSDAETEAMFVPVSLSGARAALAAGNERMPLAPGLGEIDLRASIETSLHALLPHPVVLHVHAVNTIAWAATTGRETEIASRLDGLAWRWLDYGRPGLPLAQAVAALLEQGPLDVLLLGNHGLVVGAESCDAAEALVAEVERRLALTPRAAPGPDLDTLQRICDGTDYRLSREPLCHALATDRRNLEIATAGSLYPDHVVFLGPGLPTLGPNESLTAKTGHAIAEGLPPPVALLVPEQGAVIRNDATPGAEAMLVCLALVVTRLPSDASIHYLPQDEEQALLNWDAERYRRQMTANR